MQHALNFTSVRPVSPPAAYLGGKRQLAERLASIIEQIPHALYAEPFVGMGGVFFRRRLIPKCEVINDRSGDVATLFRILQRHYPFFMDLMKFQITSRREFERLVATDPSTLTDLERAARFLYLQRLSFGGKVVGRSFGVDTSGPARFNISRLGVVLEEVHERLSGVVIENLDWAKFIERYDRPGTLFYLDPPYFGNEGDYGRDAFNRQRFTEMAERLKSVKGRFIISLNDCEGVREVFKNFQFVTVGLTYTVRGGAGKDVGEVIIMDGKEDVENLPLA
ncbi:DNA adenine methylase [Agrobacterium vitis]|uniref:site-specific DNA-methyltransferase (adenine-specific) n=1 Tax=Agrobacterium vitis TaxID=373 RepID=A0ABD6G6V2_AGRVI|nr:DNA adenine methylase [Agrobacterium vitis]MUO77883.1 DNA adenine methylase [Agrobacterium vitis]MUO93401.1 DNA adenine methylase [Agrobacterium vitis]MUP04752.1 DNA adenine methylase [Agrobacterium vitis]MVA09004.1 DNA adenine methylase [Agrobacterium vitis]MVA93058.1 DNA adenine methylase [Agrobacterium vitis]